MTYGFKVKENLFKLKEKYLLASSAIAMYQLTIYTKYLVYLTTLITVFNSDIPYIQNLKKILDITMSLYYCVVFMSFSNSFGVLFFITAQEKFATN